MPTPAVSARASDRGDLQEFAMLVAATTYLYGTESRSTRRLMLFQGRTPARWGQWVLPPSSWSTDRCVRLNGPTYRAGRRGSDECRTSPPNRRRRRVQL